MSFLWLTILNLLLLSCASHRKDYSSLKLPEATPEGQGIIFSSRGSCNASLITHSTVLTNSHCLAKASGSEVYGIFKSPAEDTFVSFKRIIYQSEYTEGHDFQKATNPDFALLELETPLENLKPLQIKRTALEENQPVFLYSLELHQEMSITLRKSKCFTFKNNWDSDYKMGLRNVFIYRGPGQKDDCIIKEGYSGSALKNDRGEMIGVLRQLENLKVINGKKQGNLGIATSMSCLDLFDAELNKSMDPKCSDESRYNRKEEFVALLKVKIDQELGLQMNSLPPLFEYSIHSIKDETDPKDLIYKNNFRIEPHCINSKEWSESTHEGEIWDLQIEIGITFDKIKGFGFNPAKSKKLPYRFKLRGVKDSKIKFVIDTPYVTGKALDYCE